jgi:hypothetical protein
MGKSRLSLNHLYQVLLLVTMREKFILMELAM